jgi:hypothetical protein
MSDRILSLKIKMTEFGDNKKLLDLADGYRKIRVDLASSSGKDGDRNRGGFSDRYGG